MNEIFMWFSMSTDRKLVELVVEPAFGSWLAQIQCINLFLHNLINISFRINVLFGIAFMSITPLLNSQTAYLDNLKMHLPEILYKL